MPALGDWNPSADLLRRPGLEPEPLAANVAEVPAQGRDSDG
jgi:hypothetical protein